MAPDGFVVFSHAGDDPIKCRDYVRERCGEPAWQPGGSKRAGDRGTDATYIYQDEHGEPYIRVSRYYCDGEKRFAQSRWTGSAWEKGTKGLPKLPYRLPELLAAPNSPIFVCEGEKDADRLTAHGVVATTASEGAGKWRAELDKWFAGRTVYVLPDNDKPGRDHANTVAQQLSPLAQSVRIVALAGLPDKGDVSDWLNAGNDVPALMAIAEAAPPWAPNDNQPDTEDDTIDAESLLDMTFDPIKFVIPNYVVEGLTILAGAPKLGKSWLAYDFSIAVATGGRAMGKLDCEQGDVLYLCLEDNRRRVSDRLKILCPCRKQRGIDLSRLKVRTRAPRVDTGLLAELDKWRTSVEKPRLIIIDVWLKVRPPRKSGADPYQTDYDNAVPLQQYASEHGLAIIIVTHTRKMAAEDRLETVNSTNGLTGVADSVLVLDRDTGMTLYGRGRDIVEVDTAMKFDGGQWIMLGDATEVAQSHERRKILETLADAGKPIGPKEIAELAGLNAVNVRPMLIRMVKAGDLIRVGRGLYSDPHHNHHKHHNDNEKPEKTNKTAPKRKKAL
jgi:hypothetical protein